MFYAAFWREFRIVASIHSSISLSTKATVLGPIFTCSGKRPCRISSYSLVRPKPTRLNTSGTRINLFVVLSFIFISCFVSTGAMVARTDIAGCRHQTTLFFGKIAGCGFRGKINFVDFAGFEKRGQPSLPPRHGVGQAQAVSSSSIFITSAIFMSIR